MRIVTYTTTDRVPPALQAIAKIMVESAFLPVVFYAATPEAAMIKAQEFWAARFAKVEQRRAKEAGEAAHGTARRPGLGRRPTR